jgi:hypothetical protein
VTVESRTDLGWIVVFEAYGSKEEVPLPYLRLLPTMEAGSVEQPPEETNTQPTPQLKSQVSQQPAANEDFTIPGEHMYIYVELYSCC